MSKPILCLDFDGVLHQYTSKWAGPTVISDGPTEGAMKFLLNSAPHFSLHIFSSRSGHEGGREAMRRWLITHMAQHWEDGGAPEPDILTDAAMDWIDKNITFPTEKPPAFLTLDDRALTFRGQWPTIESMLLFRPWNKP